MCGGRGLLTLSCCRFLCCHFFVTLLAPYCPHEPRALAAVEGGLGWATPGAEGILCLPMLHSKCARSKSDSWRPERAACKQGQIKCKTRAAQSNTQLPEYNTRRSREAMAPGTGSRFPMVQQGTSPAILLYNNKEAHKQKHPASGTPRQPPPCPRRHPHRQGRPPARPPGAPPAHPHAPAPQRALWPPVPSQGAW